VAVSKLSYRWTAISSCSVVAATAIHLDAAFIASGSARISTIPAIGIKVMSVST